MAGDSGCTLRTIRAEETRALRLAILRAGQSPEAAIYPKDEDPGTVHVGAFAPDETLVGIATYLPGEPRRAGEPPHVESGARFRGMAVLEAWRGRGVGRALVGVLRQLAREQGTRELWANARLSAVGFYRRVGFAVVSSEFEIPILGPHQVVADAP